MTDSIPAYGWRARYSFGRMYFDEEGRTNGVFTGDNWHITTNPYNESAGVPTLPEITLNIFDRPPLWASYFHLVRTKNLAYSDILYWVSDTTAKDDKYAYISIRNLANIPDDEPIKQQILSYDFTPGDRITFVKRYPKTDPPVVVTDKDYEIVGVIADPVAGQTKFTGNFVKIKLPPTDATFDFGNDDYAKYEFSLYTPARPVNNGLDTYFEFGERYEIVDAGLSTRRHNGGTQDQSSDLVTPATYVLRDGDMYFRPREIATGVIAKFKEIEGANGDGNTTMGFAFTEQSYSNSNYQFASSPLQDGVGFDLGTNDDRYILWVLTGNYTFRLKGLWKWDNPIPSTFKLYLIKNTGEVIYLIKEQYFGTGTQYTLNIDVTFTVAAGEKVFIAQDSSSGGHGEKHYFDSDFTLTEISNITVYIEDFNFSDNFISAVNSNGRPSIVDESADEKYFGVRDRYGEAYQQGTNINDINRFYPENYIEFDRSRGDVIRLKQRDRMLRAYQSRGVAHTGVFVKMIKDSKGADVLAVTDEILTRNNIGYYSGNYGIGNQPTALTSSSNADYIVDDITGALLRLDNQGIENLGREYFAENWIRDHVTEYQKDRAFAGGGNAKIILAFDFKLNQCLMCLQAGTSITYGAISGYTLAFDEDNKAFSTFYNYLPTNITAIGNKLISFNGGALYVHDSSTYSNFFGVQYRPSITFVFNKDIALKKVFKNCGYGANGFWVSDTNGDINTSMINDQTGLQQESQLKSVDFKKLGTSFNAAYLCDLNSRADAVEALNNGDSLSGGLWLEQKFIAETGSGFIWIFDPFCQWKVDSRNL